MPRCVAAYRMDVEPKYDGTRVLGEASSRQVQLVTRNGKDKRAQFPEGWTPLANRQWYERRERLEDLFAAANHADREHQHAAPGHRRDRA